MEHLQTAVSSSPFLVIVSAILGGVGRDIIAKLLSRPQEAHENYRTEIDALRSEVHSLKDEVVQWRGQYYVLLDAVIRGDHSRVKELLDQYIEKERQP